MLVEIADFEFLYINVTFTSPMVIFYSEYVPQRKVMKPCLGLTAWQVDVHQIHAIGNFFYSDFFHLQSSLAKTNGSREWMMMQTFGETGIVYS